MDESDSADDARTAAESHGPTARDDGTLRSAGIRRRPRPTGDEAAMPQVQLALGLLILFLFLLVLWMIWPVLSHA